jgi:patatin-like phospholipase/acyl hydrolase
MSDSQKRFQILSLDGGGIKGLFSAAVLAAIEEDLGTNVLDHFDLIAGTSTGGIIALGLGLGMRPREIVQFYVAEGPTIFGNRLGWRNALKWVFRKYPQKRLMQSLQSCFKDARLGDSKVRLVIPTYCLGDDDVYLFRTPHHAMLRRDCKVAMWKVALATSAAPTFFPSCRHVDSLRLIDGGVWANNPTMVAVVEAIKTLCVPREAIRVLSIGCSDPVVRRPKRLDWGGFLQWAIGAAAIDVITRGQSIGVNNHAKLLLEPGNLERLNPQVPKDEFTLDGHAKANDLIAKAAYHSRRMMPTFDEKFRPHHAAPYKPFTCTGGES